MCLSVCSHHSRKGWAYSLPVNHPRTHERPLLLLLQGHVLMWSEQLKGFGVQTGTLLDTEEDCLVKMLRLHSLLALALVSCCCPAAADVGDFAPCLQFFYSSWPPKGLTGTPICQRYNNNYQFATLYSRSRRSPWFSAYVYTVPTGKRPSSSWKFEPQVSVWSQRTFVFMSYT